MPLTSVRSTSPMFAQRRERPHLVAGELQVDVELDAREARLREVLERLLERECRARGEVGVVVGDQQPPVAVAHVR